jgi:catechol 2,3-dioxygenase-like lactoylglutathione lyase family enzyme
MTAPQSFTSIAPFFIVRDVLAATGFYQDKLGFEVTFSTPENEPFFAIVARGGARLMLKAVAPEVQPMPNHTRHPWAKWDAFVHVPNPDTLASELVGRGATLRTALGNTEDGLRGFEVADLDGYVLFFGRAN